MKPRRGDRVAPPPRPGEYDIRFAERGVVDEWQQLCKVAPGNVRAAWEKIAADPRPKQITHRHHPLHDDLATRTMGGVELDQWQYEVTGGGRIWYLIDDEQQTCWLTKATVGHPKETDQSHPNRR